MVQLLQSDIIRTSQIEQIIFELDKDLIKHMRYPYSYRNHYPLFVTLVPENITKGVPKEIYDGYRKGLTSACADLVIQSWQEEPVVLFIKRENPPFADCWWMMGGAIHAYRPVEEFLLERTEKECGLRPRIESLLGIYRTAAEDGICDTIQPCYVGTVSKEELNKINIDTAHKEFGLFTLDMLKEENLHWYPRRTGILALETIPD